MAGKRAKGSAFAICTSALGRGAAKKRIPRFERCVSKVGAKLAAANPDGGLDPSKFDKLERNLYDLVTMGDGLSPDSAVGLLIAAADDDLSQMSPYLRSLARERRR